MEIFCSSVTADFQARAPVQSAPVAAHRLADTIQPPRKGLLRPPPFRFGRKKSAKALGIQARFSHMKAEGISMEAMSENKMVPSDYSTGPMEKAAKPLPFKDPNFVHSGHGGAVAGKKNRTWKNLKQILASERALPWQLNDPNYFSIDAPPSFKPAKKYSDVSGLLANYTDPQSKLRFSTIEEFSYIRRLPSDVVTGYLALRKATSIVP
uniref:Vps72/YL1 C-terminal domain-containing protein n=3 Tax=Felidae TaxID=9681 RepID=A0ABI7X7J1_FELCA